ncbi:hypothetical protein [Intestinimonas butyriciproducens]
MRRGMKETPEQMQKLLETQKM